MKKIGLVIQGPLISIGRTGDKLHQSPEQLKREGGVLHYDCRPNINRIIAEFGPLFDAIVVSTWDNELKPGDAFPGATIVSALDPGGIKQENHYKDNNKFRQFISTLNGLNELEKRGIEHAVKIRTDIYLDLRGLIDSFAAGARGNPRAIGATVVHPQTFLLHDLYFMATVDSLKRFCEGILAHDKFEFIPSVHREMILKHAYAEYKDEIGVPDSAYFPMWPPGGVSKETRKVFEHMFKNVYFSLDPELFRKTLWRGTYFEAEHVAGLVDATDAMPRKYSVPKLICTDWERYFAFRQTLTGQKQSIADAVAVKMGRIGWQAWSWVRKAGGALLKRIKGPRG